MAYHNNMENLIRVMDHQPPRRSPVPRTSASANASANASATTSANASNRRSSNDQTRSFFTFIPLSTRTSSSSTTLTPLQIENAIETIPYTEEFEETRCPISFEDFVLGENVKRIKGCGHYYKSVGLMNWLRRSSHCPVCRYDLRDYRTTEPSPPDEPPETRRTEISQFLESIIRNIDNEIATTFDFSNNEILAEYSIDLR